MREILNSYFSSVFTKEDLCENLPEVEQVFKGELSSNLTDIVITPEVIVEKLKILKNNKASDTHGLVSDFFLRTSETSCFPLSIFFRKSLDESVVPKDFKLANVSAICKNALNDNTGNYRPIRLTTQIVSYWNLF